MQGYLTIALDRQRYVEMAINLAKSIRFFDPGRRICLVHDDKVNVPETARSLFDDFVLLPPLADYIGCINKLRIDDISPYDETMYIDADCLIVKNDIDRHWQRAKGSYFAIAGTKRSSGKWNRMDIARVCRDFHAPYVVTMNSGVFYYRKCAETSYFFATARDLYRTDRDAISNIHQGRAGQYADEPFLGLTMGLLGVEPVDTIARAGSWMVSTWHARRCRFDPTGNVSYLEKPARLLFGLPVLPYGWVAHSPTIAHFIGLKPVQVYRNAVAGLDRALLVRGVSPN